MESLSAHPRTEVPGLFSVVLPGRIWCDSIMHGHIALHQKSFSPRYAELHCKTNFSFLRGASHPDELVTQAAQLGYTALAITDYNSLAGVVRAHVAAKEAGLKILIGAEITPEDAPTVLLYAPDAEA